ncbi:MAG TPA: hypothetical protein P5191_09695 [Ruminococcus sp.]|nr:hypothetical protein [Ruminococcus sp.]
MKDIIWGIIGLIIAAVGALYMMKQLRLKKHGRVILAEVVKVTEKKKNTYVHTMRFELDGKTIEEDDRTGYSQPFKEGETKLIVLDPEKPEIFEFEEDVKRNITMAAALVAVALVFSIRWLIMGLK